MGFLALSPLLFFVAVYLVASIIIGDFYKIPITVAFLASSIYAVVVSGGPLQRRIELFSRGASNSKMMLMIWIFLLAGAFAQSAKSMGSIDATVDITLSILPSNMILAGLFLASCFISLSIGTSVGTIVALAPIAVGISDSTGLNTSMLTAIVVGGSFFGDNMSFISDTTIAATRTQGCSMRDKFRTNILIALPAAVATLLIYVFTSDLNPEPIVHSAASPWYTMLPYLLVIVAAIMGTNVLTVLVLGIISSGAIGLLSGTVTMVDWIASMGSGIAGMGELIIITMMAGGMLEMIRVAGGIDFIINAISRLITSRRGAEAAIASLVMIADVCTANNTVAIISVGGIVRDIAQRFGISARRTASLLDTFSCFAQGFLPYGAQLLMAAGLAQLSPVEIIPHLYYPFILGACAVVVIIIQRPRYNK